MNINVGYGEVLVDFEVKRLQIRVMTRPSVIKKSLVENAPFW